MTGVANLSVLTTMWLHARPDSHSPPAASTAGLHRRVAEPSPGCYHRLPFSPRRPAMPLLQVEISTEYIALNDLLKIAGVVDSGGAGKALVASGVVTVDGAQELRKTNKIRPGQRVRVHDVEIEVVAG
ncbi:hypothetical protein YWS52_16050 [Chitiniphilus shinanonensis]